MYPAGSDRRYLIRSDAGSLFAKLAEQGFDHESERVSDERDWAVRRFPLVHLVISNLKRYLLGRHHATHAKHALRYFGEFLFRFNYRWQESDLFERLLLLCVKNPAITYRQLAQAELN